MTAVVFPDREIAGMTFYHWRHEAAFAGWQRAGIAVGRHVRYSDEVGLKGSLGFHLVRTVDRAAGSWPGHLFRVGGLLRRSFRSDVDLGWCEALTVLEELPATLAFGPGGEAAAAITGRAAAFAVDEIEALGEAARLFGPRLATDPMRDRLRTTGVQDSKSPYLRRSRDPDPMDSYVAQRWIDLGCRTDTGIGHLVWEWDKIDPHDAFVRDSWTAALFAFGDALKAALYADLIEPDVYDWLDAPWSAGMAALGARAVAPAGARTDG